MTQLLFQKVTPQCEWESLANRKAEEAIICTHSIMWTGHANFQVGTVSGRKTGWGCWNGWKFMERDCMEA